jgi:large subunit ribosomal protein L21
MLAVIKTGGKQYIVKENQELLVELLDYDLEKKTVIFDEVLLVSDDKKTTIGQPIVKNSKVIAEVVAPVKGDKIEIIKYQPKKRYRRHQGHRQQYLKVLIKKIEI